MNFLIILLLLSIPLGQLTRFNLSYGVSIYLQDVVSAFMVLALFINYLKGKKVFQAKLQKPIVIFTTAILLSFLLNFRKVEYHQAIVGFLYLIRWVAYSGIYFSTVFYRKENKSLFKNFSIRDGLLISGIAFSIFGILQYFFIPDLRQLKWLGWDDHYFRLVGTLLDPGFTGLLLVFTAILAIGTKLKPQIKLIAFSTSILALFLTYSRASYLAFLGSIVVLATLRKRIMTGLIISLFFIITLFLLPTAQSEGTNLMRIFSISQRITTWNQAIEISKDNPVFGIGFNLLRYEQRKRGFLGDDWLTSHSASGIQNSYAFVLATSGILGLLAFVWLVISMFKVHKKHFYKVDRKSQVIIISLVAISIHTIFTNSWFYSWTMIWIWILLGEAEAG